MTSEKINEFSDKFGKDVSKKQLSDLEDKLKNAEDETFEKIGQTKVKSTFITVILSAFLGLFGAGSFYLGRIRAGILKVVFNVVVPLTFAIIFLVWLSPTNNLYYNQSLDTARSIYSIVKDSGDEEEYEEYNKHILVVASWTIKRPDNFKNALDEIKKACNTVTDNEGLQFAKLEENIATGLKDILDGFGLQEVDNKKEEKTETYNEQEEEAELEIEYYTISVKIGFGELPKLIVANLDGEIKNKLKVINAHAEELLTPIDNKIKDINNQIKEFDKQIAYILKEIKDIEDKYPESEPTDEDKENLEKLNEDKDSLTKNKEDLNKQNSVLSKIEASIKAVNDKLKTFLDETATTSVSLAKCTDKIKTELEYIADLKTKLDDFQANTKIESAVDKQLNYNKLLTSVSTHFGNIPTKTELSDIEYEISTARTEINTLSANAIAAAKSYYLNYMYAKWLPGTFLMLDGIVIICWWIGEVFSDREKCHKYNYEKFVEAIQ